MENFDYAKWQILSALYILVAKWGLVANCIQMVNI
jgi:hypothetical protein